MEQAKPFYACGDTEGGQSIGCIASRNGSQGCLLTGGSCMQRLDDRSRMSGDVQVRFCERLGGRFPGATRRVCAFQHEAEAERFYRTLPKRLKRFGLDVAEEKTNCLRFSRHHLRKGKRFTFLGFEFYWDKDRKGLPRVKRRTAPKKLQGACRRIKEWIKDNRHLPKRQFVSGLNRRLTGHYNYFGIIGNGKSINRFYRWATKCTYKWLNRRGGKRKSFSQEAFWRAVNRGLFRSPRIVAGRRREVWA